MIVQGTYDEPSDLNARWLEYEFLCKPGAVTRRPCIISPYHYRLDWLMWFAAFQVTNSLVTIFIMLNILTDTGSLLCVQIWNNILRPLEYC